nr:PI-PLC X domain-containing protein At5g67130-like [Tanacetum cinerariifolium]
MLKFTSSMFITSLIIAFLLFPRCSSLKEEETCVNDKSCDSGLQCGTCTGNVTVPPRCIRVQPHNPLSKVRGLPYNRYTWLMTHNSFARMGHRSETGAVLLAPMNQQDSVTSQLENGVRGLMLDMYDFENDIWLCHSFHGKCFNYTAFVHVKNSFLIPEKRRKPYCWKLQRKKNYWHKAT